MEISGRLYRFIGVRVLRIKPDIVDGSIPQVP